MEKFKLQRIRERLVSCLMDLTPSSLDQRGFFANSGKEALDAIRSFEEREHKGIVEAAKENHGMLLYAEAGLRSATCDMLLHIITIGKSDD